jgi:hypothetical protein
MVRTDVSLGLGFFILTFARGLVASVQGGIHSWSAMMALRFFMGVSEAGFGPGIPVSIGRYILPILGF